MTLYTALVVSVVFASGTFLLLQRDLLRVVVGIVLLSNSATLFIMALALTRGEAPILPFRGAVASDPLVQAMALTALVIGFGVAALLLAMVYRLYLAHQTIDQEEIAEIELRQAEALERADNPEIEEVPDEELEDQDAYADTREVADSKSVTTQLGRVR